MIRTKRHGHADTYRRMLAEAHGIPVDDVGRAHNRTSVDDLTGADPGTAPANVTIPTDRAELEEMLGDSKRMQSVFKDKELFAELIGNFARTEVERDVDMRTQIKDEVQKTVAGILREMDPESSELGRIDLSGVAKHINSEADRFAQKQGLHNPKAMGAQLDGEFTDSADYFRSIWHNANRDAKLQSKLQKVRNAFSSTVPSEGGYLIPETLRSELLRVALETSIVRPRARVIPMDSLRVPFPAVDSTTNVGSVYGGIVGYWTEEGAALTESAAAFSRIVLDAKKLTAYTEVPNELISDSAISFQAFIDQVFPEALAFYEDAAFFSGTGVGEPLGFLNAQSAIEVEPEGTQSAGTILWENIVHMFSRMLPASLNRAVWVASIDTFPQLAQMSLRVGDGGSAIWLNNGVEGPPMTILGRPVIFTEKAPLLGLSGDISFVDFGFYLIGDRQVMSATSSQHYRFQNDVTAYRIINRVDGRPWLNSAIEPANGGPTLSPFVKLETRSGS